MSGYFARAGLLPASFAAVLILAGCQTYDPGKVKLTANSQEAVLLVKVKPVSGADYWIGISEFDVAKKTILSSPFQGMAPFQVLPRQVYLARTVTPGTYAFTAVSQQMYWNACLQSATYSFEVKPGEVLFLGDFDPEPQLEQIQKQAKEKGQLSASQTMSWTYFDDIPPPSIGFEGGKDVALANARQYVATSMPGVSTPSVRLAEYQPTTFGNGYNLYGDRICGGYFKKSAEQTQADLQKEQMKKNLEEHRERARRAKKGEKTDGDGI